MQRSNYVLSQLLWLFSVTVERVLESSPLLKFPCFSAKISTPPSHLGDESKAITHADVVMPDTVIAVEQA